MSRNPKNREQESRKILHQFRKKTILTQAENRIGAIISGAIASRPATDGHVRGQSRIRNGTERVCQQSKRQGMEAAQNEKHLQQLGGDALMAELQRQAAGHRLLYMHSMVNPRQE